MHIVPISNNKYNNFQPKFEAGQIKILNPHYWVDAELRAFVQNDEFKKIATKLKKKNLDLFVSVNKAEDRLGNHVLSLFSGKNNNPQNLIQKIEGPIWCCTPERRSLIDNIVLFPQKIESLFAQKDTAVFKEKQKIAEELKKKNIFIRDVDYWHISELKALKANKNFDQLYKKFDLEDKDKKLHFTREYSEYLGGDYIEVSSGCTLIGTILARNNDYNSSSSITDAITNFNDFTVISTSDELKQSALTEIEKFNKQ